MLCLGGFRARSLFLLDRVSPDPFRNGMGCIRGESAVRLKRIRQRSPAADESTRFAGAPSCGSRSSYEHINTCLPRQLAEVGQDHGLAFRYEILCKRLNSD